MSCLSASSSVAPLVVGPLAANPDAARERRDEGERGGLRLLLRSALLPSSSNGMRSASPARLSRMSTRLCSRACSAECSRATASHVIFLVFPRSSVTSHQSSPRISLSRFFTNVVRYTRAIFISLHQTLSCLICSSQLSHAHPYLQQVPSKSRFAYSLHGHEPALNTFSEDVLCIECFFFGIDFLRSFQLFTRGKDSELATLSCLLVVSTNISSKN